MTGMSQAARLAAVDARTASTLYLRLLIDTTTDPDQLILDGNHQLNDDGSFPTGLAEASAGGYAPLEILAAAWSDAAMVGELAVSQCPKTGDPAIGFTATGADIGDVVGWALTTDTAAITSSNFKECGRIRNTDDTADTWVPLDDGATIEWTVSRPLKVRQGPPAAFPA